MTKKTFLPARLVEGARWYIVYYQIDPGTGQRVRFREKAGLNRIPNLADRRKAAQLLIKEINSKLPSGWPFGLPDPAGEVVSLRDAVQQALAVKLRSDRKNTHRSYRSITKTFITYAQAKGWDHGAVGDFDTRLAKSFLRDVQIERSLSARTYNNYLIHLKAIWYEMREEEIYMGDNPWVQMRKLTPGDKQRRTFTEEERRTVASYIYRCDPRLFLAVLLMYYCLIRPVELRRMRYKMIDPVRGCIILPGAITKSRKRRVVTIPRACLHFFREADLLRQPANYYIFGEGLEPHPTIQCSPNAMNKRHRRHLLALKKQGKLPDITGLTLYSWKDTGVTDMSRTVSLPAVQGQAGHAKPETTMLYYQPDEINPEVRGWSGDIFS